MSYARGGSLEASNPRERIPFAAVVGLRPAFLSRLIRPPVILVFAV